MNPYAAHLALLGYRPAMHAACWVFVGAILDTEYDCYDAIWVGVVSPPRPCRRAYWALGTGIPFEDWADVPDGILAAAVEAYREGQ